MKRTLKLETINAGGYIDGGYLYMGGNYTADDGTRYFLYVSYDVETGERLHVRATSRANAKRKILELFPQARFYR